MNNNGNRRSFLKYSLPVAGFVAGTFLSFKRNIGEQICRLGSSEAAAKSVTEKSLEHRIETLEALHDVQELMSRYFHYHVSNYHKRCWEELFSHKMPDVSAEIADWGKWEGPEHVKAFYLDIMGGDTGPDKKNAGQMHLHQLDTPCIQVAGDLKTAKGVWFSPGHETGVDSQTGKGSVNWCWSSFGTDFIKEDGVWKIWHYHCYAMIMSPFDKPWTELTDDSGMKMKFPEGKGPNKPTTYFNEYRTTKPRELVPAPPMPYETFDPKTAY